MDKKFTKNIKGTVFVFSLSLNLIFLILAALYLVKHGGINYLKGKTENMKAAEQTMPTRAYFYNLLERFYKEEVPVGNGNILFLGDSHFGLIPWREYLSNNMIINRAIQGDNLQGMIDRIDSSFGDKISEIFILAGSNDIDVGSKSEQIISSYIKLLQTIKSVNPVTKIFVISIFPMSKDYPGSLEKNNEILKTNNHLQKLQKELDFKFIDMHSVLKDESNFLKEEYSYDGLHLNTSGYSKLKKVLLSNLIK